MNKIVIGIDPGKSGSIIIWRPDIFPMVLERTKVSMALACVEVFKVITADINPVIFYIEQVSSRPADGVVSAFKFGREFQFAIDLAIMSGTEFNFVRPQVWQQEFNLGGTYPTKTARKNAHKKIAQKLFPSVKITHANADALLIAEYGRRDQYGLLKTQTKAAPKPASIFDYI